MKESTKKKGPGVEHDDGEGEDVARVRVAEDVGVELAVALRERLHHAVDLLRLARQPKRPQELAQSLFVVGLFCLFGNQSIEKEKEPENNKTSVSPSVDWCSRSIRAETKTNPEKKKLGKTR